MQRGLPNEPGPPQITEEHQQATEPPEARPGDKLIRGNRPPWGTTAHATSAALAGLARLAGASDCPLTASYDSGEPHRREGGTSARQGAARPGAGAGTAAGGEQRGGVEGVVVRDHRPHGPPPRKCRVARHIGPRAAALRLTEQVDLAPTSVATSPPEASSASPPTTLPASPPPSLRCPGAFGHGGGGGGGSAFPPWIRSELSKKTLTSTTSSPTTIDNRRGISPTLSTATRHR